MEYSVTIYDKPGADRTPIRPTHLKRIVTHFNSGVVTSACALFKDETKTSFVGSQLNVIAEKREDVIELLKTDVYYTEGIWDIDSVRINPIGVAHRSAKVNPDVNPEVYT